VTHPLDDLIWDTDYYPARAKAQLAQRASRPGPGAGAFRARPPSGPQARPACLVRPLAAHHLVARGAGAPVAGAGRGTVAGGGMSPADASIVCAFAALVLLLEAVRRRAGR
jgi:hypothetical protein